MKYGYITPTRNGTAALRSHQDMVDAVKDFQRFAGLKVTGEWPRTCRTFPAGPLPWKDPTWRPMLSFLFILFFTGGLPNCRRPVSGGFTHGELLLMKGLFRVFGKTVIAVRFTVSCRLRRQSCRCSRSRVVQSYTV